MGLLFTIIVELDILDLTYEEFGEFIDYKFLLLFPFLFLLYPLSLFKSSVNFKF